MSSRIQDALPVASVGSSAPAHAALGIASGWDWDELSGPYRTRLVAAGVARFGLRPEECEDALQGVFVKILLQAPRVRDPKAYLKPWGGKLYYASRPDWKVTEFMCKDNQTFDDFRAKTAQ